ncbi:hypothetical protein CkaCkLH20_03827 [Colletotrichum karsti]|uniref:Uncharacterized protein n=1 Tax=Colletotrichum karsti TaxID=1095194 RepID=A0A9P6LNU9_9PEZI|nr:uncharacterized protein CkaCkLH20_03827 [Colletotrichum karsti]KAF9878927.1 hypothetical protein CkaCkLH20_03827 [Colletotrichum karsti]
MKSFLIFAALSPLAVLADPPACIGHVVGMQGMPSDIDTICHKDQKKTLSDLVKKCAPNELKPAYDHFAEVCKGVDVDVAALPTPSAPAPTPSESKPASAAAAIAPHAVIFTILGLSTTGLFSMMFL